ncbi:MAG: hypothetical protein RDV48_17815 [Candidatus Eremiobacteraeota bacterium]|nr:hypothetical protein [Candidatus Eremiobacteraeota bacterium]
MKTFYTYDTGENKNVIKVLTGLIIISALGIVGFGIATLLVKKAWVINMSFCIVSFFILVASIPARKKLTERVKNENLVAHDWGVEYLNGEEKREVKWEVIQGIDTLDRSGIAWKLKEHIISVANEVPISFFSNLENSDFLVNYVKKNLKKRGDGDLDVKWVKDKK